MTDVVETEVTVPHADSNGTVLEVGNRVRVSNDQAEQEWDFENDRYTTVRDFDFGTVTALNEDGTVEVAWDAAGCGCGSSETGARTENASDLTLTNQGEIDVYYIGYDKGYDEGRKSNQRQVRYALGLPEPVKAEENTVENI